jgi:hypothetical protein
MRISSLVRLCVAYVAAPKVNGTAILGGTGFYISRLMPGHPVQDLGDGRKLCTGALNYFITARHVVEQVRQLGAEELFVRNNLKSGGWAYLPCALSCFTYHPDPTVDLAVVHTTDGLPDFEISPWILDETPADDLIARHNIGVGTGVSIIGLFRHHTGTERNLPIVRTGNIAAMPEERVSTKMGAMDAMLIEARSVGGLSGSPVFANLGRSQTRVNSNISTPNDFIAGTHLIGVMHGHYDENADGEKVNVGIGIVTPVAKLLEIMNLPAVLADEQRVLERQRARDLLSPRGDSARR